MGRGKGKGEGGRFRDDRREQHRARKVMGLASRSMEEMEEGETHQLNPPFFSSIDLITFLFQSD